MSFVYAALVLLVAALVLVGWLSVLGAGHQQKMAELADEARKKQAGKMAAGEKVDAALLSALTGSADVPAALQKWTRERMDVLCADGPQPWDWDVSHARGWAESQERLTAEQAVADHQKKKALAVAVCAIGGLLAAAAVYLATASVYLAA